MTGQKSKKRSFNKSSLVTGAPASADILFKQSPAPAPAPQPIANGARVTGDRYARLAAGATPLPQPLSEKPRNFTAGVGQASAVQRDTSKGPAVQTDIYKSSAAPAAPATPVAAESSEVDSNGHSIVVPAAKMPPTANAIGPSAVPKREVMISQPAAAAMRELPPVKPVVTAAAAPAPAPAQRPVATTAAVAVPAPVAATKTLPNSATFVTRCITFVLQAYTLPVGYSPRYARTHGVKHVHNTCDALRCQPTFSAGDLPS